MASKSFDEEAAIINQSNDLCLSGRGQKGGRHRGHGDRSGGGRVNQNREVMISKSLSKLLRHEAVKEGLSLDREGFARLDQVVRCDTSILSYIYCMRGRCMQERSPIYQGPYPRVISLCIAETDDKFVPQSVFAMGKIWQ